MPALKTYDIFICHAWKYGSAYERLINLLDNALLFKYRNYSRPEDRPLADPASPLGRRALNEAIRRQIRPVNCVLVISGMYLNHSEWMQTEIDLALEHGKPIIGIKPWGNTLVPQSVQNAADVMVAWQTSSIVDAIRAYSL
jgi:hypothetical protein